MTEEEEDERRLELLRQMLALSNTIDGIAFSLDNPDLEDSERSELLDWVKLAELVNAEIMHEAKALER